MPLALVTFAGSIATGCATEQTNASTPSTSDSKTLGQTELSKEAVETLRGVLLKLDAVEGETFAAFLPRAQQALLATHPELAASVGALEGTNGFEGDSAHQILPTLLGVWTRGRAHNARLKTLTSLVAHRTTNTIETKTPGRGPEFDALEADLAAQAKARDLQFLQVDHVAYEVSLSDAPAPSLEHGVAVLTHSDVVPAGEVGWKTKPFEATVQGNRIMGRGVLDDKGAIVAVLSALSALKDSGAKIKRTPFLIVGTSEETHWDGIERYQQARGMTPDTIVADGSFPVGVGEKGITTVRVTTAKPGHLQFSGGQVSNQVPATASVHLDGEPTAAIQKRVASAPDITLSIDASAVGKKGGTHKGYTVTAHGKAAHSAEPELGKNAIQRLMAFGAKYLPLGTGPCAQLIAVLNARLIANSGQRLGVTDSAPGFSPSTVNLGTFKILDDGRCQAAINVRWPPYRSAKEVVASVSKALVQEAAKQTPVLAIETKGGGLDPFVVDKNAPLVVALLQAYSQVTGKAAKTIYLSGTTYAKAVKGAVTFGPEPEEGAGGRMHGANEFITLDELDDMAEMYAFALARLVL